MTFDATTIAEVIRAELRTQGWQTPKDAAASKLVHPDTLRAVVYVDTIAHAVLVRLRDGEDRS